MLRSPQLHAAPARLLIESAMRAEIGASSTVDRLPQIRGHPRIAWLLSLLRGEPFARQVAVQ